MEKTTLSVKFDKKHLFTQFVNRTNMWLGVANSNIYVSAKDYDWFMANVDFIARKLEPMLTIILVTPPTYYAERIDYEFSLYGHGHNIYLSDCIEKYLNEKLFEYYLILNNIPYRDDIISDKYFNDIKSIALKKSKVL